MTFFKEYKEMIGHSLSLSPIPVPIILLMPTAFFMLVFLQLGFFNTMAWYWIIAITFGVYVGFHLFISLIVTVADRHFRK